MKPFVIMSFCLILLPGVLSANPLPEFYITEFSTEDDWIELYGYSSNINGALFTVNGDTITIDEDATFEFPCAILNQENTSGFDLPEEGGDIEFLGYWAFISYGTHGSCPAPPSTASAASLFRDLPSWSESGPSGIWSLDFTPTPGAVNDHQLPASGEGTVFLNEFSAGEASPFVELYNRSDEPCNIGGWRLTSALIYTIPEGTIVSGHGFYAVGGASLPDGFFRAPASGTIYLVNADGELVDQAGWTEETEAGKTLIRYPDGFVTECYGLSLIHI